VGDGEWEVCPESSADKGDRKLIKYWISNTSEFPICIEIWNGFIFESGIFTAFVKGGRN